MLMRVRRITGGTLLVLLIVQLAACSLSRRHQIAVLNNRLSSAGKDMGDFVQKQYDMKLMSVDDYEDWKDDLGKVAKVGRLMTEALIAGNDDVAAVQVDAFFDLLDELQKEGVVKLNPNQQAIAYVILGGIRTTLDILMMTVL